MPTLGHGYARGQRNSARETETSCLVWRQTNTWEPQYGRAECLEMYSQNVKIDFLPETPIFCSALTVPLQCPYSALTVPFMKTHSALTLFIRKKPQSRAWFLIITM